jgi:D-aminoacyl-tRNA deacylase
VKAILQRVSEASVTVDGTTLGKIGPGLMILVCAMQGDDETKPAVLAAKIAKLRIFRDDQDKMNRSLLDTGGAALVISQFTLAADTSRGNRPGFSTAAHPSIGAPLYEAFVDELVKLGITIATGRFGADMKVQLINDGPVTISLEV